MILVISLVLSLKGFVFMEEKKGMSGFQRILVLSPHTDDGEFGCGGTIAKLVDACNEVFYVAFSSAEKSVPSDFPNDILKKEVSDATKILGIPSDHLIILNYEVREFPRFRQDILEDMIKIGADISPELVLLPSSNDTHYTYPRKLGHKLRWILRYNILYLYLKLVEEIYVSKTSKS